MRPFAPVWTIVGLLVACGITTAGDSSVDRSTLRGITSVPVLIEQLSPDAISHGLTKDQIQTDVELRLRKAGITVPDAVGSGPYLYVHVGLMKDRELDGLYVIYYDVSFHQLVFVVPTDVYSVVPTWSASSFGDVGGYNLAPTVRSTVADLVDEFINAYLSVNPKN
jgi:hypothetical protein